MSQQYVATACCNCMSRQHVASSVRMSQQHAAQNTLLYSGVAYQPGNGATLMCAAMAVQCPVRHTPNTTRAWHLMMRCTALRSASEVHALHFALSGRTQALDKCSGLDNVAPLSNSGHRTPIHQRKRHCRPPAQSRRLQRDSEKQESRDAQGRR